MSYSTDQVKTSNRN